MFIRRSSRFEGVASWFDHVFQLITETFDEYSKDRGEMVAAALAFYTLLSIAPLIIIAVAIAGAVLGKGAAESQMLQLLHENMSPSAAQAVHGWALQAAASGGAASLVGFCFVLFAASRLTTQLRTALNQVWNVDESHARGFRDSVRSELRRRLVAFLLVLGSGPVLIIVVASRALLAGLSHILFADTPFVARLAQLTQLGFSFVLVALMCAVVFKVVPDTRIGWRAVAWGAVITSLLFNVGNWFMGLYLARATIAQTYGAAASAVVVLLWLYFSAQLFVFGAEFTQVYAAHFGRGISPSPQHGWAPARSRS
jgi:membrane protein